MASCVIDAPLPFSAPLVQLAGRGYGLVLVARRREKLLELEQEIRCVACEVALPIPGGLGTNRSFLLPLLSSSITSTPSSSSASVPIHIISADLVDPKSAEFIHEQVNHLKLTVSGGY